MTRHILFVAAGLKLAARACQVRTVHEQLAVQAVAGTTNWFLGLGVANGRLLPVTDLGAFAGRQSCTGRILELDPSVGIAALKVDEVPGFSDAIPLEVKSEQNSLEHMSKSLTLSGKSIKDKAAEYHLLDVDELVHSEAFINIKEKNPSCL
ncbi:MAG: chemotaxis protein CheW [Granulosicoccus sp.]